MQYLVTAEFVDPGPLLPPEQLVELIRQMLLPTHDALTNLKAQGKVIAGAFRSERGPQCLSSTQTPMQSWTAYCRVCLSGGF